MATTAWVCLLKCMTYEFLLPEMSWNRCWYTGSPVHPFLCKHKVIVKEFFVFPVLHSHLFSPLYGQTNNPSQNRPINIVRYLHSLQMKLSHGLDRCPVHPLVPGKNCTSHGKSMDRMSFHQLIDHYLGFLAISFVARSLFWIHCHVRHIWCIQHWTWKSLENRVFDSKHEPRLVCASDVT